MIKHYKLLREIHAKGIRHGTDGELVQRQASSLLCFAQRRLRY